MTRLSAVKRLEQLGTKAEAALSALKKTAEEDKDYDVRAFASKVVTRIELNLDKNAGEEVGKLVEQLDDPDPIVRIAAIKELEKMGPEADAAAFKLQEVADKDLDRNVRLAARRALGSVDAEIAGYLEELKNEDAIVRIRAVKKLEESGSKVAIAPLEEAAENDPDQDVRTFARQAAASLREMTSPEGRSKKQLEEIRERYIADETIYEYVLATGMMSHAGVLLAWSNCSNAVHDGLPGQALSHLKSLLEYVLPASELEKDLGDLQATLDQWSLEKGDEEEPEVKNEIWGSWDIFN